MFCYPSNSCVKVKSHFHRVTNFFVKWLYQTLPVTLERFLITWYAKMCSAGVGRTGTFIGLDVLKAELEARREVNVLNAVYQMRLNRTEMVQSLVSCISSSSDFLLVFYIQYLNLVKRFAFVFDERKPFLELFVYCLTSSHQARSRTWIHVALT